MVIDTSAVVAILFEAEDGRRFADAIEQASIRLMSAVTRVELSFVIEGRKGPAGRDQLERLLARSEVEIASVTAHHAAVAIEAFRDYGKGRHKAGLNIGDCFAYALAKTTGLPLLFKGEGFSQTDILRSDAR
jgi:ribonuclease VapC